MQHAPRHTHRGHLPDVRPLDRLSSIKIKLGVLVGVTVTVSVLLTWVGLSHYQLGPSRTLPVAVGVSLLVTQLLARGMTSPLREMTSAVQRMAHGDYSQRVSATSRDEVGLLATAFNRMAEDLESVDLLRREMVANVSHELRTPVAALQAQLENMVDGVTEPTAANLGAVLAQTERLSRLVTYLLDLSRLEAGAAALDISEVGLSGFLEEVADDAVPLAAPRGVTFAVDVEPATLTVPADGERLYQIVANLLHNAVRHSPRDGVVTLSAHRAGSVVLLDVTDQGPGIAREDRAQVFERFRRGNTPVSTGQISTGGTGLGLAIVRWAVELHGGSVEVADVPVGCTMRLRLPVRRAPARTEGPAGHGGAAII